MPWKRFSMQNEGSDPFNSLSQLILLLLLLDTPVFTGQVGRDASTRTRSVRQHPNTYNIEYDYLVYVENPSVLRGKVLSLETNKYLNNDNGSSDEFHHVV